MTHIGIWVMGLTHPCCGAKMNSGRTSLWPAQNLGFQSDSVGLHHGNPKILWFSNMYVYDFPAGQQKKILVGLHRLAKKKKIWSDFRVLPQPRKKSWSDFTVSRRIWSDFRDLLQEQKKICSFYHSSPKRVGLHEILKTNFGRPWLPDACSICPKFRANLRARQ